MTIFYLIPLFPLMGVLILGILGKRLPKSLIGFIACATVGLSFIASFLSFIHLLSLPVEERTITYTLFTWIKSGNFKVNISFLFDSLSCVMTLYITGVGLLIHIYSTGYMHEDEDYSRYFTYLNLFMFSMLTLVLADNFLLLFLGWELVGLCSYLLIGFWFEKKSAADAGKKAFIVNRVGDFGFILGVMLIFVTFGSLDYNSVISSAGTFPVGETVIVLITLLLFIGACGKSAQLPLYVWLPDAMEGPTPVSALIHAATMVTAGVYMVCRCSFLYQLAPFTSMLVAVTGVITALFAATIALVQNDIKRVLAYSTISQLGYMFLAAGVGAYVAAIFHLVTHAFFKALLFLGAGSVMHALAGETNVQKMGGLKSYLPITSRTFIIASLALAGIFPFAGFFSKDEILYSALTSSPLLWVLGIITTLLTAFYIFRIVFLTFYGNVRLDVSPSDIHESPSNMTVPLIILAVLSTIGGFLGIPLIKNANLIHNFLHPLFEKITKQGGEEILHSPSFEFSLMLFSLGIAFIGLIIAYKFFILSPQIPKNLKVRFPLIYRVLFNKYYVDEIYNYIFVLPGKFISHYILWKFLDVGIIDGTVNLVGFFTKGVGKIISFFQTGLVRTYAFIMVLGITIIIYVYFIK